MLRLHLRVFLWTGVFWQVVIRANGARISIQNLRSAWIAFQQRLGPSSLPFCVTKKAKAVRRTVQFSFDLSSLRFSGTTLRAFTDKTSDPDPAEQNSSNRGTKLQREQTKPEITEQNAATNKNTTTMTLQFSLHSSITDINANDWDACLTSSESSPFLQHAWLRCLEESGCASPQTGWLPQHISIRNQSDSDQGVVLGYVPLYIKGHSLGEFIFDQSWAEAAYQSDIDYYPKLLIAVPFTPAAGQRMLWTPAAMKAIKNADDSHGNDIAARSKLSLMRQAVGGFLKQLARSNKISSVHCNFLTDDEATDLAGPLETDTEESATDSKMMIQRLLSRVSVKDGYLRRTSIQYHWINRNPKNSNAPFESFDEYLTCFKSKRRITIKRERNYVWQDQGIDVTAVAGRDILQIPGLVERMFEIYKSTVDKMAWGRQYLTLDFFQRLAQSEFIDYLCFLVCSRRKGEDDESKLGQGRILKANDAFAGTFNIVKDGVFYGRYWGCLEGEIKNLHFETCYWSAIEYCIKNGIHRMEPGAG